MDTTWALSQYKNFMDNEIPQTTTIMIKQANTKVYGKKKNNLKL